MSEVWLNFSIIIFIQFFLFIIHAYYEKKFSDVPRILGKSILSGIVLGLLFDLIFGKFFGLWSYTLGFGALPLTLSAALMYGLFTANILLMQRARLSHFFVWTTIMVVVYEISNHFFHVWRYELALPPTEFLIFLLVGYLGTGIVIAIISHILLGRRFLFIDDLLKK